MPLCGSSSSSKQPLERKIVILGDGACGKTSLLNVFTRGYFPKVYEPTVFENYIHDIFVDGQHITLSLWDTAGQEEFDRLRSLSYSDTHTIMLCFSVDSRDSLENVQNKWVGEIADHCEGVKLVLVALKCDLRNSNEEHGLDSAITPGNIQQQQQQRQQGGEVTTGLITYEEGLTMAKKIGALRYLECSAKLNRGVNEAFTEAARCALTARPKGARENATTEETKKSKCVIM
ncbi:LAMI_0C08086g1_1 [Lachancea mirantina]|uniref:GTP-binding protein RHO3 n=1 Tax=Lachancea mirantina TaxID=1230905 RepID=A0A1G4J4F0_9SACH|nr:LAMI_0C08086g1_1 [Lachancea mirantina]